MTIKLIPNLPGAAAIALLLFCGACSTSTIPLKVTGPETFAGSQDFGGQIVVNAIQTTNTVLAIDAAHRRVTLKNTSGKIHQYKAGPQVVNFNQLKVGDIVKATVVERMSIFLRQDSTSQSLSASALVVRPLPGAKPAVVGVETLDFTATVLDINNWLDQVTLQGVDGLTRTVSVGESVNLANFNVGDQVTIRITEALAILIEKP